MARRRAQTEAFSLFAFQDIITSVTGVIILVTLLLVIELVQRESIAGPPSVDESTSDRNHQLDEQIEALRAAIQASDELVDQVAELPISALAQSETELSSTKAQLMNELERLESAIHDTQTTSLSGSDEATVEESIPELQLRLSKLEAQLESLKKSHHLIYNRNPFDQKQAWLVDLSIDAIRVAEPGNTDHFIEFSNKNQASASQFVAWAKRRSNQTEYFVLLLRPKAMHLYESIQQELSTAGFDMGIDLIEADATVMGQENSEGSGDETSS